MNQMQPSNTEERDTLLYQRVADELAEDIQQGLYQPGQKIPSVRQLSRDRNISISTVNQAYSQLEDLGLIYAKPQSGYFVRFGLDQAPASAPVSIGDSPSEVTKGSLIKQMLADSQRPSTINLGAAIPATALLPYRSIQNHIQKAARFQHSEVVNYQFSPGYEPLRNQIAQRMRNLEVRCHQDEVVITQGCTEAISLCLRANTEPGDTVAVESPCYYGFIQIAEALGLKVIEIPTDPNSGMSIEALQLALQQWSIKLVLISTRFSTPTGCSLPQDKQQKLVALLNQYKIRAIEDDIYGELGFTDSHQTVLKTFDTEHRVIYCSSFSKTVAPGLRVGWCLPGPSLEAVKSLQTFHSLGCSSLPQCAMASYLQHGHYDKHLRSLRRTARDNMAKLRRTVRAHFPSETLMSEPQGGFVLWVYLPSSVSAIELKQLALQYDIAIIPGDMFSNTDHFSNAIRLSGAMQWDQSVELALEQLGKLVGQLMLA